MPGVATPGTRAIGASILAPVSLLCYQPDIINLCPDSGDPYPSKRGGLVRFWRILAFSIA
jgi:hypothetical protein